MKRIYGFHPLSKITFLFICSAQTGSGKTAGFLFPIIITMIRNGGSPNKGDPRRRTYPEALVLAPTREVRQMLYYLF